MRGVVKYSRCDISPRRSMFLSPPSCWFRNLKIRAKALTCISTGMTGTDGEGAEEGASGITVVVSAKRIPPAPLPMLPPRPLPPPLSPSRASASEGSGLGFSAAISVPSATINLKRWLKRLFPMLSPGGSSGISVARQISATHEGAFKMKPSWRNSVSILKLIYLKT